MLNHFQIFICQNAKPVFVKSVILSYLSDLVNLLLRMFYEVEAARMISHGPAFLRHLFKKRFGLDLVNAYLGTSKLLFPNNVKQRLFVYFIYHSLSSQ